MADYSSVPNYQCNIVHCSICRHNCATTSMMVFNCRPKQGVKELIDFLLTRVGSLRLPPSHP
jgi:hypothetical protein